MDIDLKDQILVLDEAHNVEDSARDAASFTINAVELQDVLDDLDKMGKEPPFYTHPRVVRTYGAHKLSKSKETKSNLEQLRFKKKTSKGYGKFNLLV